MCVVYCVNYLQIGYFVVCKIVILVMHMFLLTQLATNEGFHYLSCMLPTSSPMLRIFHRMTRQLQSFFS